MLYVCFHITLKNNDMKSFLIWLAKEISCIGDILYIPKPSNDDEMLRNQPEYNDPCRRNRGRF